MAYAITNRISKPGNCIIGFGIPTSENGFFNCYIDNVDNRFAKGFSSFPEYQSQFIQPYKRISSRMITLGTRIVPDLTLSQFGSMFDRSGVHAVILFSHWQDNGAIEFKDGFADINSIIDHVPRGYAGILDLCVCHPNSLINQLRPARPNCIIKWINLKVKPISWLYFYWALFQYLNHGKKSYMQGLEDLIVALIQTTQK